DRGDVHDEGVVGGPALRGEDGAHRLSVEGERPEAVDRLRGEGHQLARAQKRRGPVEGAVALRPLHVGERLGLELLHRGIYSGSTGPRPGNAAHRECAGRTAVCRASRGPWVGWAPHCAQRASSVPAASVDSSPLRVDADPHSGFLLRMLARLATTCFFVLLAAPPASAAVWTLEDRS